MEQQRLSELLPGLRDELQAARAAMQAAAARVEALEKTISGLEYLAGAATQPALPLDLPELPSNGSHAMTPILGETPRGQEAVRRVLSESDRPMKAQAVIAEIKRRGWVDPAAKNPGAAIRVAIRRLAEASEVERVETGVYRYRRSTEGVTEKSEA